MQKQIYHFGYQQKAKKYADVLEITRLSNQKDQAFRQFCSSDECENFTEINVIYKDEDEDWINLMPLWASKNFKKVTTIYLKEYPITDEEKHIIRANLHNFPSLQTIQIDGVISNTGEIQLW